MTRDEFDKFWSIHLGLFPGLAQWVQPRTAPEWYGALFVDLPFADCVTVSRTMFADGSEVTYGRHGLEIARRAKQLADRRARDAEYANRRLAEVGGDAGPRCVTCCDQLWVLVKHRRAINGVSVRCTQCVRGAQVSNRERESDSSRRRGGAPLVYDPSKMHIHDDWHGTVPEVNNAGVEWTPDSEISGW